MPSALDDQQKYFGYSDGGHRHCRKFGQSTREKLYIMIRFVPAWATVAAVVVGSIAFITASAAAAPDKAAVQDATAKCKAQVKEQAKFQEMSLMAKHKAVKKCVSDILAGQ